MKNKRAQTEILHNNIVMIIAIILLFSGLMFFVHKSSTGAVVYEELYSKQIALILEKAKPDSEVIIDFEDGFEILKENNLGENAKPVEIDNQNNKVIVMLSGRGGYETSFFSDYDISVENLEKDKKIKLIIRE